MYVFWQQRRNQNFKDNFESKWINHYNHPQEACNQETCYSIRYVLVLSLPAIEVMIWAFMSIYKLFHPAQYFSFSAQRNAACHISATRGQHIQNLFHFPSSHQICPFVSCSFIVTSMAGIFLVPCNPCMQHLPASASREHVELHMQVHWAGRNYDVLHTWQRHNSLSAEHPRP